VRSNLLVAALLVFSLACGAPGEGPGPQTPAAAPQPAPVEESGARAMTGDLRLARRYSYYAAAQPNIAADASGRVALGGRAYGNVDFGGASAGQDNDWGLFVVRLDESGQPMFVRSVKASHSALITALACDDAGFVAIAGHTSEPIDFGGGPVGDSGARHIFVVKLDPEGNQVWARVFKDAAYSYTVANAIAIDRTGNVFFAGGLYNPMDFGGGRLKHSGGTDAYVVSLDAEGKHRFSESFGSTSTETATGLALDPSGQPVVIGSFNASLDFGAGQLRGESRGDIFVLKLDANGKPMFAKRIGGEGKDDPRGVAVDGRGNIFVSGTLQRGSEWTFDAAVIKLDPQGNELWRRSFTETTSYSDARPIAVDAFGNVVLAGYRWEEKGGQASTYVVKLGPEGEPLYARKIEGQLAVVSMTASPGTSETFLVGVGGGALRYGKRELPVGGGQTLLLKLAP
jgi:outer membrane protein assembly factor BamB